MWALEGAIQEQGAHLTRVLRDFSEKNVKISEADKTRSKKLVKDYIKGHIMEYCGRNSPLPIHGLEHTGSVYERLKTEALDEVDFMVVVKTANPGRPGSRSDLGITVEQTGEPGYVRFKVKEGSNLHSYASPEGYISPERFRGRWLHSLVSRAAKDFNDSSSSSDVRLHVRQHGPAVQLDITEKKTWAKLLSVDLVPSLETDAGEHFVPKPNKSLSIRHPDLLWRQSFSLEEKATLKNMDKNDQGCRHELFRIVKTLVQKEPTSFGALNLYHLKTAFMHYIKQNPGNWADQYSLGRHFVGYLGELKKNLDKGNLQHFWIRGVNLIEQDGIEPTVTKQMANRLKNILEREPKGNPTSVSRNARMQTESPQILPRLRIPPSVDRAQQIERIPLFNIRRYDACDSMETADYYEFSRFRMFEDSDSFDYGTQNPIARALKCLFKFLFKLLLGLVLLGFSLLIYISWLAGVGLLIILTWFGLSQID